MALFCKKCSKETDVLAEGLCVDCYRAMGKDSLNVSTRAAKPEEVNQVAETEPVRFTANTPVASSYVSGRPHQLGIWDRIKKTDPKLVSKLSWGTAGLALTLAAASGIYFGSGEIETGGKAQLITNEQPVVQEEVKTPVDWKHLDSDNDRLPDQKEINKFLTDPYDPDTDHDGVDDYTELVRGTNPLKASGDVSLETASGSITSSSVLTPEDLVPVDKLTSSNTLEFTEEAPPATGEEVGWFGKIWLTVRGWGQGMWSWLNR